MAIQSDSLSSLPDSPRIVAPQPVSPNEESIERALRPKALEEYVGQQRAREQLEIFIAAARKRGEALDHVLLFGPPGLGKTTLAHIIAHEMGVQLRQTSGPVLERPGDLAALLTNLERNDVLFIDEIHRLSPVVEEILYPALEDFQIDILIGEGPAARSVKLDLQPFTLVGATTRAGMLTNPLRDRFGIVSRLEFYNTDELAAIKFGIDPVHFGIILVTNIEIGLITPPLAANVFVAARTLDVNMVKMLPHLAWFFAAALSVLLLISFVPELTLWFRHFQ